MDISRLTDQQQDEYRSAYQEYIAQMAQVDPGSSDRPLQPQPGHFMTSDAKDPPAGEDGRKAFAKRPGGKAGGAEAADGDALDPITEEDEKGDHASSKALLSSKAARGGLPGAGGSMPGVLQLKPGGAPRYQKLTSDDDESEESDNAPPLRDGKTAPDGKLPAGGSLALKGKDFLSDAMLDKKDSSDSGVRSNESSPNHSLQDEEAELSQPYDGGKRGLPSSLSGLQDAAVARMSICSEDQCSLLASSPEDSWPRTFNLNRTPSSVTLNNNSNATGGGRQRTPPEGPPAQQTGDVIISASTGTSGGATRPGPNNENVRVLHLKRGLKPGDPPEICTVSSDTVTFGDERESIL
ncbi:kinase D-interacting substrate of 220 kDa B-like [Etheostoma cragini]|uniref:kinase D-interacting substrate of 220 kDa B-like n=1 Tax=Etheostoma cragini TaxID=417921 RepID=UPI00155ED032|nr:kinase D-interacting substrate of 220 kDa B-like [Etheostoma cragini]